MLFELFRVLLKCCKTHEGFALTSLYPFRCLRSPGSSSERGSFKGCSFCLGAGGAQGVSSHKIRHSPQIQTKKGEVRWTPLDINTQGGRSGGSSSALFMSLVSLPGFPSGMGIPGAPGRTWLMVTCSGLLPAQLCPQHTKLLGEFIKF